MSQFVRVLGPFYIIEARISPRRPWKCITDWDVFKPYNTLKAAKVAAKKIEQLTRE